MHKKRGLILGKMMPPHDGHLYLINFARNYLEQTGGGKLYVVIDRIKDAPIEQSLITTWLKALLPDVEIIPLGDFNPQSPDEDPEHFWDIWEKSLKSALPEPVDYVFGSEQYCWTLAERLNADCIPVDNFRENFPISGTEVRADPFAVWEYLPEIVRPHFAKKVCIVGSEATGKSVLAERLADYFNTACVPEYAKVYLNALQRPTTYEDIEKFAFGQIASENSLVKKANRVLICDTDVLTTKLWSQRLYNERYPVELDTLIQQRNYDLYIVANPDTDWVPDAHRQWTTESFEHRRKGLHHKLVGELCDLNKDHVIVTGKDWDGRFEQAKKAIIERIFNNKNYGFAEPS